MMIKINYEYWLEICFDISHTYIKLCFYMIS